MDPFIGEIRIFGFNYAPESWAYCDGTVLPTQQNPALYSLIGNIYGGTANQSFGLPNLQSQVPMGALQMTSSSITALNQSSGAEKVMLNLSQLPSHTHSMGGETTGTTANQTNVPSSATLPNTINVNTVGVPGYSTDQPNTSFSPLGISGVGGNGTHENRQPFLAMNLCICLDGIYPSFP